MVRDRKRLAPRLFARRLRKSATTTERMLWQQLRRRGVGVAFRRQAPLLGYVVDFYCASRALVIEVDGGYHKTRRDYDRGRDAALAEFGIETVRFSNRRVQTDMEGVVSEIAGLVAGRPVVKTALSGLAGRTYLARQLDAGSGEWV